MVDATTLQDYTGGIVSAAPGNINHAVTIVGFGSDDQGTPYWTVLNSWGADWGEQGFFRVLRGQNAINIETQCLLPKAG